MVNGELQITGLTRLQLNDYTPFADMELISGSRGIGPVDAVVFMYASNLVPGAAYTLQMFPSGYSESGNVPANGVIGLMRGFYSGTPTENYLWYGHISGGPTYVGPEGFYSKGIRGVLSISEPSLSQAVCSIYIQISGHELSDFPGAPGTPPPPTQITPAPVAVGPDENNNVTLTWTSPVSDENAVVIERNGIIIGSVPAGRDTYTDVLPPTAGSYTYTVIPVSATTVGAESAESNTVTLGPQPEGIIMTMSGGLAIGGAALITFIVNPSGIYTLEIGKTHDTLINRAGGGVASEEVKIPRPFVRTGLL